MIQYFIFLFIFLLVIGALVRDDFAFTVLYFLAGAFFLSRWWSNKVISKLSFRRIFDNHAFPGQPVDVKLEIHNRGWLPIPWLYVQDGLSIEIRAERSYQEVVSMAGFGQCIFEYTLKSNQRGYYPVGPLRLFTGDILGLGDEVQTEGPQDHLIVYPKVIALNKLTLPSRSPMGTLRTTQLIFEDPSRPTGKRPYVAGDSLRRIDWKASASSGQLQVKLFDPSIALETALFLNLDPDAYHLRSRFPDSELAIVVAASIANWVSANKQAVGVWTNGADPLAPEKNIQYLPARKGHAHLMRLLEVLARIKTTSQQPFTPLVAQHSSHLGWGTTVVLITPQAEHDLFDQVFRAQRAGLNMVLILCGSNPDHKVILDKARQFGVPAYHFTSERDLDIWRI
jgi:uncharacterized protein (DUF58 family)